jgi:hypothetical protein
MVRRGFIMPKITNHLIGYTEWKEWEDYQNYTFEDEKVINNYDAYKDTPSKEECEKLCKELSGEVVVYKIK